MLVFFARAAGAGFVATDAAPGGGVRWIALSGRAGGLQRRRDGRVGKGRVLVAFVHIAGATGGQAFGWHHLQFDMR